MILLKLRDVGTAADPPWPVRLRRALKCLLRAFRFREMEVREMWVVCPWCLGLRKRPNGQPCDLCQVLPLSVVPAGATEDQAREHVRARAVNPPLESLPQQWMREDRR